VSRNGIDTALLDEKLAVLETARTWPPRAIARLEALILSGDDYDLFRVNPVRYAADRGLAENDAIDLFLHGAKCGLFDMEWHTACAFCAHVVTSFRDLARLHAHFTCDFCGAENRATLDDLVQVAFTVAARIRPITYRDPASLPIDDYYLRYHFLRGATFPGGLSLEEVSALLTREMAWVAPGQTRRVELAAEAGMLQVKDLAHGALLTAFLGEAGPGATTPLCIELDGGRLLANGMPTTRQAYEMRVAPFHFEVAGEFPGGKQTLEYVNRMQTNSALWLLLLPAGFESDYVTFEPCLSGKRLLSHQTFRDLFRHDTVSASEGLDVRDITLLFTDLKGSTALYERIGDLNAYHLVRQHFDTLRRVVAGHSGAIVKTIGDAVMASFVSPADAVAAAVAMLTEIAAFNATVSDHIVLKIGIHRGPSIVVALNDRLDFFGQTVNIAARMQGLAGAGEICISAEAHGQADVGELLSACAVVREQASVKGVSEVLEVYRVTVR
jgi:class 3 adenylate cyclase